MKVLLFLLLFIGSVHAATNGETRTWYYRGGPSTGVNARALTVTRSFVVLSDQDGQRSVVSRSVFSPEDAGYLETLCPMPLPKQEKPTQTPARSAIASQTRLRAEMTIGGGRLVVSIPFATLYVDKGNRAGASILRVETWYEVGGKTIYDTEGFFSVDGVPSKLTLWSEDESVVCNSSRSSVSFAPRGPGTTNIRAKLQNGEVAIPVHVVALPFAIGDSTESLIERFGIPDYGLGVHVDFPDSRSVHGIVYTWDGNNNAIHWKYSRFPGSVVVCQAHAVVNISSTLESSHWSGE